MECIIDNREHSLIEDVNVMNDISFTVESLDLADIDIRGTSGQRFLFERKSIKDLASSLNDGRFKDQKDRLLGVLEREPLTAIAYIIEGGMRGSDDDRIQGRITLGMLKSLLYTIQLKYRIPIIYTINVKDTSRWIRGFVKYLIKKPDFCPVGSGSNAGCSSYKTLMPAPFQNRSRDAQSMYIAMLTVIPGVSHKIASGIIDNIGNPFDITNKYTRDEFKVKIDTIQINGRRMSQKVREQLCDIIYPSVICNET